MKAYTDLEQSEKLAEFLPLESADMFLALNGNVPVMSKYIDDGLVTAVDAAIPCWSLAALLEEIPSIIVNNVGEDLKLHIEKDNLQYYLFYENEYTGDMFEIETELYDDMIDAAFEMIIELHELNLL